ncbi:diazepam-binding inhibitor (GABA receptor modulator) [Babesia microti strain RI]|uniref:Diazepam-binding inhibitor (GABA receptor modulator) n=1 Tax=Babesia microti (strain RI) TaxID=1133968 RepID=I7IFD0_BABMR|nr:diazepam-binding inhibitor (GABA receptor modulator) [Babesia microti strain RI]CCF72696.1 diazepam-binding inhibitor (GABA receptor modulator) [Babesia microti strain RI]|eukprot:XP_012647305.1 diazepam-binding inhibitor (GABA receptor modulator) [Babesia microti strain RI]
MEETFKTAVEHIRHATYISVSNQDKLLLYAYYKQAMVGNCNVDKPGLLDFTGRAKWDAWNSVSGKSKQEAMDAYVQLVNTIDPGWQTKC